MPVPASPSSPAGAGDRTSTAKLVRLGTGDPSLASSTSHLPVFQHRADSGSKPDLRQLHPHQQQAVPSSPTHQYRTELQVPPSPTLQRTSQETTPARGAQSKRDSWKEHEANANANVSQQPAPFVRTRASLLNLNRTSSMRDSTGSLVATGANAEASANVAPRVVRRVMPATSAEKAAGGAMSFSARRADRPNSTALLSHNYNARSSRESLQPAATANRSAVRAVAPPPHSSTSSAATPHPHPHPHPHHHVASTSKSAPVAPHEEFAYVDDESQSGSESPHSSEHEAPPPPQQLSQQQQLQQQLQFRFPTSYSVPIDALAKYRLPSGAQPQATNENTTATAPSRSSGEFYFNNGDRLHTLALPFMLAIRTSRTRAGLNVRVNEYVYVRVR